MCCAFVWLQAHAKLLLLIAFNRDEFLGRPTEPAHLWKDHDELLAGRDVVNGGTWLGITRSGRFAFVTNFRELQAAFDRVQNASSRGALPRDFLLGSESPQLYAKELDLENYNGFNLVIGDIGSDTAVHVSNRGDDSSRVLGPGLHGISNGAFASNWPKVARGKDALKRHVEAADLDSEALPWDSIFQLLSNPERPAEAHVPRTGVEWDMDLTCSSLFVPPIKRDGLLYGTRCQTVIAVWASGRVELQERWLDARTMQWQHHKVQTSLYTSQQIG